MLKQKDQFNKLKIYSESIRLGSKLSFIRFVRIIKEKHAPGNFGIDTITSKEGFLIM